MSARQDQKAALEQAFEATDGLASVIDELIENLRAQSSLADEELPRNRPSGIRGGMKHMSEDLAAAVVILEVLKDALAQLGEQIPVGDA